MRQVSPAQSGLPTSVDRYLLPDERSVITVRMHPAALAGPWSWPAAAWWQSGN